MARSAEEYTKLLQSLLPKGRFWTRDSSSDLKKLLEGLAQEFVRIEERTEDLINEKDSRYTDELLSEFETEYGIPEYGEDLAITTEKRRGVLTAKKNEFNSQHKGYYIELAADLGWTVIIQEYTPAWAGMVTAGSPCGDQHVVFYWTVLIDCDSVTESAEVNITKLINKIMSIKPAHTHVLFNFYNRGFDRGFASGFARLPHYDNSWLNPSFDAAFSMGFENNTNYDGVNYTGGFRQGFSIDFDRYSGGGYEPDGFDSGFWLPR